MSVRRAWSNFLPPRSGSLTEKVAEFRASAPMFQFPASQERKSHINDAQFSSAMERLFQFPASQERKSHVGRRSVLSRTALCVSISCLPGAEVSRAGRPMPPTMGQEFVSISCLPGAEVSLYWTPIAPGAQESVSISCLPGAEVSRNRGSRRLTYDVSISCLPGAEVSQHYFCGCTRLGGERLKVLAGMFSQ